MEDLLVHSIKCPFCGRTFERIEEAILKEKEIWNMPDSWTDSVDSNTLVGTKIYDYPRLF